MGESEAYRLGRRAYIAYARHRQWTAVDGTAMPPWSQQREDIQAAWICAALAVALELDEEDGHGMEMQ